MTVGEAIKLLKINGFTLLNQRGSHQKYGNGDLRFTIIYHSVDKETLCKKTQKNLSNIIKQSKELV